MTNESRLGPIWQLQTVLMAGALGNLSDGELVQRFVYGRGDPDSAAAFAAIVERHGPMVRGVCQDVLRDIHDAEDASQATFLILAKRCRSIRQVDSLASWLFGVALRVAARARAEAARRREFERRGGEMKARFDDIETRSVSAAEIYEELDRLPERFRAPIVLCHLQGLTNEQAAGQLGLPVRTIQRRLAQGRERLRRRLGGHGIEPPAGMFGAGLAASTAPEAWLEATVRAAAGLAAGRKMSPVASSAVTALTEGVLTAMFIGRMRIVAAAVVAAGALFVAMVGGGAVISSSRNHDSNSLTDASEAAVIADAGNAAETPDPTGPWIKGLVVDTYGRAVGGARVSVMRSDLPRTVTSKADGTFVIGSDGPYLRYLSLLATVDNGARQGIFRFHDRATGPKDARSLARIVLKPLQNVTVSVVDDRGLPVAGASVVVLDVAFPVAEARTDARGIVELSAPADVMAHWIFGYKSGIGFDYFENYLVVSSDWSPLPERVQLVLNGARTMRVRAVDSANNPLPGVEISPLSILKKGKLSFVNLDATLKARTDARGIATFDWLPVENLPRTNFLVATPSYAGPIWPGLDPDATSNELTLRMLRLTPISGKVTRPDGSPAAGILVTAEDHMPVMQVGPRPARSAADGSYAIEVTPDRSYTVYVTDEDWASRTQAVVDVREGVARTGVDFRLEKGSVIRGRVTGGEPPQAAPGLFVTLVDDPSANPGPGQLIHDGPRRIVETDRDGRYAFRVGPGEYVLAGPSELGVSSGQEQITLGEGQDVERHFRVSRLAFTRRILHGVIRAGQPDGPPIARAIVIAAPIEASEALSHTFANGAGKFELSCPFGRTLICARDPTGNLGGYAVVDGRADSEITVVARQSAIAHGRVVDGSGAPYENVRVAYSVSTERESVDATAGAGLLAQTDDVGRFSIPGLFVGARCRLYAIHPTGGGRSPTKVFQVSDTRPIDLGDVVLHPR